ncbi:cross-pathway control 1 [Pestalotiopsis sp. NC0098]|nr:cross-pathway control 1 [Pestalotiopsis sp. NC0098]
MAGATASLGVPRRPSNAPVFRLVPRAPVASVKISPKTKTTIFSTQPFTSALPFQVDLNFFEAIPSSQSDSSLTNATIPPQDFSVFTTDSQQSTWPPSSSPSLPATPAQQQNFLPAPQQDFVLFDQPARTNVNCAANAPATNTAAASSPIGSLNTNRRHSSNPQQNILSSPAIQNQRVAQIIQATGHKTTTSAFSNRFISPAQNQQQSQQQLYASLSAPSSTVALNSPQQSNRSARPPVPLFTQSNNQQGKMDLQDALSNFEDFTALEAGASGSAFSSPAVPAYDMHSASSSTTNIGTVSPQDLLIREPFSAPNSTAFTNLTSPSLYDDSPEFPDLDVSPHFGAGDFDTGLSDPWFPLFPDSTMIKDQQTQMPAIADNSPPLSEDLDMIETTSQPRRKSSNSPSAGHGRHSSVAGVNSRRRDKPLPPIIVDDPADTTAMKRARNTLAARKSRERKAQRLDDLELKIAKLEEERDHWKRIALSRTGS